MEATLSVLFTDAVASTASLARLGDERFEIVQAAHLGLLRAAAAGHGGREVKSLGDGLLMVFTGAADSLGCAVGMQQAVEAAQRRGDEGLALRVGVAAGDVTVGKDGDVHGSPVVEAARLCAAARGGQVLASEVTRRLAGSRGGHAYTPLGLIELKGFEEPVGVVEVGWAPLTDAGGSAPLPLPPRLAQESAWSFVGRSAEIEQLEASWREVEGGSRRVVLLAGEPGVGKTRLARELAVRAHKDGALALFGRVDEDLEVAYQPFAEALAHYLAAVDDATRMSVLEMRGGVLGRLVPEMLERAPEGQIEAWAMFEGLVDWLAAEGRQRPVVLVLDDLHWAASPTLGALMHLARSDRLERTLVVGTYRDTELGRAHPLASALADLRREDCVRRLSIRGLDLRGVAAFVEAVGGRVLDDDGRELAARLSRQTEGNPFFVSQILRHLAESGAGDAFEVPEGVREVVGRRVSRLSASAGELLQVAAVAGPEFETAVVAAVAGQSSEQALDGFDDALAGRLLLETNAPGRLRFAHALVRQALTDELTTLRRVRLHREIAVAIERRYGDDDRVVAELAHHFAQSAVDGEGERAAHYAERAAVQAMDRGGIDQAIELLQRALDVLPPDADPGGLRRDRLFAYLCHCGWVSSDLALVARASEDWLGLAHALGDDSMRILPMAWLVVSFLWRVAPEPGDLAAISEVAHLDAETMDWDGREALSLTRSWTRIDAPAVTASFLSTVAAGWALGIPLQAIAEELPADNPLALADEACRFAARSAYPLMTDQVRFLRGCALVGAPDAEALLETAERAIEVGVTFGGGGWTLKALALARLARLDELCEWADAMVLAYERSGDRAIATAAQRAYATEALARGRYDKAQLATDEILAILPEDSPLRLGYALLTVARQLADGDADQARHLADALDAHPALDLAHLVGAVAVAQDDLETARRVLDHWMGAGQLLPSDISRPGRLWGLARCAHALGDGAAAAVIYDRLLPYDGQLLLFGTDFAPASAAFILGQLAEALDRPDRALRHYTDALALEHRCDAHALGARTRAALDAVAR
jgi:class 3 adenylate cyclase/tetratricopeptide (TPR) repeat protein